MEKNTLKNGSREELNAMAAGLGLNPADYKNKAEIVAAIKTAMAAPAKPVAEIELLKNAGISEDLATEISGLTMPELALKFKAVAETTMACFIGLVIKSGGVQATVYEICNKAGIPGGTYRVYWKRVVAALKAKKPLALPPATVKAIEATSGQSSQARTGNDNASKPAAPAAAPEAPEAPAAAPEAPAAAPEAPAAAPEDDDADDVPEHSQTVAMVKEQTVAETRDMLLAILEAWPKRAKAILMEAGWLPKK